MSCLLLLTISLSVPSAFAANKVLSLDGDGDYVDISDSDSLDISGNEITISAWINTTRLDKRQVIAAKTACGDNTWLVEINPLDCDLGILNFFLNAGGSEEQVCSSGSINVGTWYHVAFIYDGANRSIYINGQYDVSQADSGDIPTNNQPVRIGAWGTLEGCGGTPNRYFYGKIDEVAIYNRALTPEEIQSTMDTKLRGDEQGLVGYWPFDEEEGAEVAHDLSPYGNDGTLYGDASFVESDLQLGWWPTILSIVPNHGSVCGGTQVVLKGDMFQEGATVSIGGSELVNVIVFPEVAASLTSQSIDITDVAPDDVTLSITLKEKSTLEVIGSITLPTDSALVANILVLKAFIEISIANSPEIAGKIIVSVDGVDSAVAVTFTTVNRETGVQLSIEQLSGSDVLFAIVVGDEGRSEIIGTTSPGTVGLHDVVVTNPDGESDTLIDSFVYMPLVGDVSGNCEITAYDAALVLQYTVGIIDQFPADSPISQAAQKYISGEITIEELDRILQKWGYPSVFRLLGLENQLLQNFPNPFNPDTWIPFKLATDASVTINIYNTKGQLIRTITLGNKQAGIYTAKYKAVYWDGRCSLGEKVASGVYYYTLQAGDFKATRKMVIMK